MIGTRLNRSTGEEEWCWLPDDESDDEWLQHHRWLVAVAERHEEDKRRVEDEADQQRALEYLQLNVSARELSVGASEQMCQPDMDWKDGSQKLLDLIRQYGLGGVGEGGGVGGGGDGTTSAWVWGATATRKSQQV